MILIGTLMPRPKSFDPDTVLAKAMVVFWEKGYDAASISDLTEAMGINRFSLYDTFGDKHTLYLKTLDAYSQRVADPMILKMNQITSLSELEGFFSMFIEYQHSCECSPCCMMHRAAISLDPVDDEAKERVQNARARFHKAFLEAFERMNDLGELRSDLNLNDAAWIAMIAQAGIASHASSPIPESDAKSAIKTMLMSFQA